MILTSLQPWIASLAYSGRHPLVRAGLIVGLVLTAALFAVWLGYWHPTQQERVALMDQIEAKRRTAVEAVRAVEIMRSYESAARAIDAVEKKLNTSSSQADLVQHLARIASKHQIRILSQSYSEGKAQPDYQPLFLDISLEGGYTGMRDFLISIATLPVWIEVQDTRLERSRDASGLLKGQIRLMTYRPVSRLVTGKGGAN